MMLKILFFTFSVAGLCLFFSCAYSLDISVNELTHQEFASIPDDIPIQIFRAKDIIPEYYQKIASLAIEDPREYGEDIEKTFRINALDKFKNTARAIGAHGVAFIEMDRKIIAHLPGHYSVYDRHGKRREVYYSQPFSTYKYRIEGTAIRYRKSRH